MSNHSYSIAINNKDDIKFLFQYLKKSEGISHLIEFMKTKKDIKTKDDIFVLKDSCLIKKNQLFANLIVDRADLYESIYYEHDINWNPVFFELEEFETKKLLYSEIEIQENHQHMVDYMKEKYNEPWIDYEEHKKQYNHCYIAKNMLYLKSKNKKWTEKEALSLIL